LAVAVNGDVYVADTLNHRVRVVDHATGLIRTVAGSGRIGTIDDVGDHEPALQARLNRPMGLAVAPNGDLYIADTGHHRVRRVSADTGRITTVAGDGQPGSWGDDGRAAAARLAAPMGLALASSGRGIVLYIADALNDRVRVIDPDGTITTLAAAVPVVVPTRIAYHPAGWLYFRDGGAAGVTALPAPPQPAVARAAVPAARIGGE
jgi:DNA-binding beta-propeller fold protein YncE